MFEPKCSLLPNEIVRGQVMHADPRSGSQGVRQQHLILRGYWPNGLRPMCRQGAVRPLQQILGTPDRIPRPFFLRLEGGKDSAVVRHLLVRRPPVQNTPSRSVERHFEEPRLRVHPHLVPRSHPHVRTDLGPLRKFNHDTLQPALLRRRGPIRVRISIAQLWGQGRGTSDPRAVFSFQEELGHARCTPALRRERGEAHKPCRHGSALHESIRVRLSPIHEAEEGKTLEVLQEPRVERLRFMHREETGHDDADVPDRIRGIRRSHRCGDAIVGAIRIPCLLVEPALGFAREREVDVDATLLKCIRLCIHSKVDLAVAVVGDDVPAAGCVQADIAQGQRDDGLVWRQRCDIFGIVLQNRLAVAPFVLAVLKDQAAALIRELAGERVDIPHAGPLSARLHHVHEHRMRERDVDTERRLEVAPERRVLKAACRTVVAGPTAARALDASPHLAIATS
mmetsp:Transcript_134092/g.428464  ORF Transcript_134092/g.428464 Transcript_134092/m.428464 type:complete len:452 (+) Transcript_134092:2021-3376(+)